MIATEHLRILPERHGDAHILRFEVRDPERGWRTVLSHRAENKHRPWEKDEAVSVEDLEITPSMDGTAGGSAAVFTEISAPDGPDSSGAARSPMRTGSRNG